MSKLAKKLNLIVKDYADTTSVEKNYARYFVYDKNNLFAEYNASSGQLLAKYTSHPQKIDDVLAVSITAAGVTAKISKT